MPEANIDAYINYLKNKDSAIRYWRTTGILIYKDKAKPAFQAIKAATNDESL